MVQVTKRPRSRKCLTSAEAWERVECVARRLSTTRRLGDRDSKQVSAAISLLNRPSESSGHHKYRQFLDLVRQKCGLQAVRLCAVALGQNNVRDMKTAHRKALINKLSEEQHRTLINNQSFSSIPGDTEAVALLERKYWGPFYLYDYDSWRNSWTQSGYPKITTLLSAKTTGYRQQVKESSLNLLASMRESTSLVPLHIEWIWSLICFMTMAFMSKT